MSQGQALNRHLPRAARLVLGLLVVLPMLAGLAFGVLAWRLSTGPIESRLLADQIASAANRQDGPWRIEIGRAAIAWEGWHGNGAPIDVRLSGVILRDRDGVERGALPDAALTFALAPLLRGMLAPATIELRGPRIALRRDASGVLSLDLARPRGLDDAPAPDAAAEPSLAEADETDATAAILTDMLLPADERAMHTSLRRIRVTGATITIRDEALGRNWSLLEAEVDLLRLPGGGAEGDGEAVLRMGELRLPVHVQGGIRPDPGRFHVRLDLPVLRPTELSSLLPELAPLAMVEAPVAIQARAEFDLTGRPTTFGLNLQAAGGGNLRLQGAARLPFEHLEARFEGDGTRLSVEEVRFSLPGPAALTVLANGTLSRGADGWGGEAQLSLARLDLADLPTLWPDGLAPEARDAARLGLPRGTLHEASVRVTLAADPTLTIWRATAGRLQASLGGLTVVTPDGITAAIDTLDVTVAARPGEISLESLLLRLPAPAGAPASTIAASGAARLAASRWAGTLDLTLDRVGFRDLPALWPEGLAPGVRDWITQNVTAGEISNGRWQFTGEADEALAEPRLSAITGEAQVSDATVHWLRPIPPVRGVAGRASFGLTEVTIQATGGRQQNEAGQAGGFEIRDATLRFLLPLEGQHRTEMTFAMAGPAAEMVTVLRHPRLRLFDRRPFPVQVAAGALAGRLDIAFPLVADLTTEMVRLRAEARVTGARLTRLLFDRDLEEGNFDIVTDTEQLRLTGTGTLNTIPLRLGVEMDFRPGPASQIVSRESLTARADAERIAQLGFDAGGLLRGPVGIEARTERRRNGQSVINLRGDLRDAVLSFPPLAWAKRAGTPGSAEAVLRMQGEQLNSIENIRIVAPELVLRGRAVARAARIERVEVQESALGASRFVGDARAPTSPGAPWTIALRGPVLDLRSIFGPSAPGERAAPVAEGTQPPFALELRFDQVLLGPQRDVFALQARGQTDTAGVLREATLRGRTARQSGAFEVTMVPQGGVRQVRGVAEDGGALLRAMGIIRTISGGRLTFAGQYADTRPGTPLTGTAELDEFTVSDAPALGKLLQAMTLFGLVEAVQGGNGLVFTRAVIPFSLSPEEVRITDARAFSASLGLTARGRVLRENPTLDLEGTIVPAYFFNTLLGNLPLIGRLFSPEAGGGVFAATFRAQGPPEDAEITVNPLAALTPGFLRGIFGLNEAARPPR